VFVPEVTQHSVTRIISVKIVNLVTPKVGAKHKRLFDKPASEAYQKLEYTKGASLR